MANIIHHEPGCRGVVNVIFHPKNVLIALVCLAVICIYVFEIRKPTVYYPSHEIKITSTTSQKSQVSIKPLFGQSNNESAAFQNSSDSNYLSNNNKTHKSNDSTKINIPTIIESKSILERNEDNSFLVKTLSCKIPNLDPYDKSVKSHIGKPKIRKCSKGIPLTYQSGTNIYVNWTAVNLSPLKGVLQHCKAQAITRPVHSASNHNSLSYSEPSEKFNNQTTVSDEYIYVKCYDKNDKKVFENFHSFVLEKQNVEKRCKILFKKRRTLPLIPEENLNILFVGLDSVSRLNSMRFFKKTRKFLLEDLHSVEMVGHNVVGDGTFENLVPLLTGKYVKELPWSEKKPTTFDRFSYIWTNYSKNGFRTVFLEDLPHGALFDYIKPGFHNTPTDYYNRHFHLAMHGKWYNANNCFLDKLGTDFVLDYTYRFVSKFRNKPHFVFSFLTQQTHDYLEQTATVDEQHFNFLKNLKTQNLLNNTILFYFADHGLRFGYIRTLYMGKMEERLPMMFVSLPEWFRRKYPNIVNNLKRNSRLLTTNFDIYETLLDILYFQRKTTTTTLTNKQRGYSILRQIPQNRSCKNADISLHWCACTQLKIVNTTVPEVQSASKYLLKSINDRLSSVKNLCADLKLTSIAASYRIIPNSSALSRVLTSYQLTIRVSPGGGLFEGTIIYNKNHKSYTALGDVSRVNSYSGQKRCNVHRKLEMFCYCK